MLPHARPGAVSSSKIKHLSCSTYEQHAITSVMTLHEHSEHAAPNRTCIFFHNVAPRHSHTTQPAHRGTGSPAPPITLIRACGPQASRIGQGVGTRHVAAVDMNT